MEQLTRSERRLLKLAEARCRTLNMLLDYRALIINDFADGIPGETVEDRFQIIALNPRHGTEDVAWLPNVESVSVYVNGFFAAAWMMLQEAKRS